jgi:hypothetical protein
VNGHGWAAAGDRQALGSNVKKKTTGNSLRVA